ncbi:MAG: hypothetical protein ACPGMR_01370 [Pontibacterium sp.]
MLTLAVLSLIAVGAIVYLAQPGQSVGQKPQPIRIRVEDEQPRQRSRRR